MAAHDTAAASRYPLTWPIAWPRTPAITRRPAAFSMKRAGEPRRALNVATAIERLDEELGRLGAKDEILSTNLALRLDGRARADQGEPSDPGVAVYFVLKGAPRVLACDKWSRVADNIAAIAAHIEAIRAVDRYGVGTIDQAFAGYAALPPAASVDWAIVLGVSRDADLDTIDRAFKAKARAAHPDAGGDPADMARLNVARAAALAARGR